MTDPDVTIIALLSQIPLGSLLLILGWTGLCYLFVALNAAGRSRFKNRWPFTKANFYPLALAVILPFALVWIGLFLLAVGAAFWGTSQLLIVHSAGGAIPSSGLGSLGLGTLLAGLLGGPLVIWGTYLKHRTVNFQKEGHLTDRIAKAVEQLGAEKTVKEQVYQPEDVDQNQPTSIERTVPNIEVRIGGILSLERIAQDSTAYDKGRDHIRCMEILCVYIRWNAKAPQQKQFFSFDTISMPRTDIQIAITAIGRRTAEQIRIEADQGYRLDLRNCDLRRADLKKGSFAGALFVDTCLDGADFSRSDLTATRLDRCSINGTIFSDATICGTYLYKAKASAKVSIFFSGFSGSAFQSAFIEGADLSGQRLPREAFGSNSTFGASDTILPPILESEKKSHLDTVDDLGRPAVSNPGAPEVDPARIAKLEESGFRYWTSLTADDLANGPFWEAFRKAHNLYGWPHDDT